MSTKIQSKPLYASLVAVIMAVMLAMSSIGMALGAPDNTVYAVVAKSSADGLDDRFALIEPNPISSKSKFYDWDVSCKEGLLITTDIYIDAAIVDGDIVDLEEAGSTSFDLTCLDLDPGMHEISFFEVCSGGSTASQYSLIINVIKSNVSIEIPSVDENNNVAFSLNFRTTGIQATGFSDYKEAFAALNNGRY